MQEKACKGGVRGANRDHGGTNRGRFAAIALPRSYRPVPPRETPSCLSHIYLCTSTCIYYLAVVLSTCSALPCPVVIGSSIHFFFRLPCFFSLFFSVRYGRQEVLHYFNSLRGLQFRYFPLISLKDMHGSHVLFVAIYLMKMEEDLCCMLHE